LRRKAILMAILKTRKMREIPDKELDDKLREIHLDLSKDRGSSEIGTVKNPGRIKEMRRTIARILTEKQRRKTKGGSSKQ
jgi:large subunit ribosomal protein L29